MASQSASMVFRPDWTPRRAACYDRCPMPRALEDPGVDSECETRFQSIGKDVFVPDCVFPAEIAIVFGMTTWRRPVARAVQLYQAGLAKRLLFTGGFNARIGAVEASEMARE